MLKKLHYLKTTKEENIRKKLKLYI